MKELSEEHKTEMRELYDEYNNKDLTDDIFDEFWCKWCFIREKHLKIYKLNEDN